MKNKPLNRLIAALSVLALPLMVRAQTSLDLNKGKINVEQWVARHFARQGEPPFSFTYGGQPSSAFLKTWGYTVRRHVMPQTGATQVVYTYTAPDGSLQVSCGLRIRERESRKPLPMCVQPTSRFAITTPPLSRFTTRVAAMQGPTILRHISAFWTVPANFCCVLRAVDRASSTSLSSISIRVTGAA